MRIETPDNAQLLLEALGVAGVRFYYALAVGDHHRFQELVGSIERAWLVQDGQDVEFVIVDGPEYQLMHLRLSQCDVAPLLHGRPAWEHAFTIDSLRLVEQRR